MRGRARAACCAERGTCALPWVVVSASLGLTGAVAFACAAGAARVGVVSARRKQKAIARVKRGGACAASSGAKEGVYRVG